MAPVSQPTSQGQRDCRAIYVGCGSHGLTRSGQISFNNGYGNLDFNTAVNKNCFFLNIKREKLSANQSWDFKKVFD